MKLLVAEMSIWFICSYICLVQKAIENIKQVTIKGDVAGNIA